ncbi:MAG: sigma-54-dependent Fis family transcriptional regulator [Flavobacteriales bacterium]|nr:sigma-54-dependent Fis family transcriptional regulator [Flavobacteriales bacterium]
MINLQTIKQRFEIIGNDPQLNRALEKAVQVAPTEISVLVVGESGVGKEFIPKIIHQNSARKHEKYIAVNCGAIPEGTIDSELFGHEKGAFTGADKTRKGYFEVADNGTIFLDEIGELPMSSQVRLLRVLENGEFIKVGSSNVQKTNVRIIAATNVNMMSAVENGKFREDLYYRLNTVQIDMPALRNRKEDIHLLFRKFSGDFAEKYGIPNVKLTSDAVHYIANYYWPGNIRQLKNFAEQITVLEKEREISLQKVQEYLPNNTSLILSKEGKRNAETDFSNEREILYKILFDMRKDLNDLKSLTLELINNPNENLSSTQQDLVDKVFNSRKEESTPLLLVENKSDNYTKFEDENDNQFEELEYEELQMPQDESLSIVDKEIELIRKALDKYKGKRKSAAKELGISERTLYRKIKQYDLE